MPAVVVEVDHVVARANGGSDDPSNLVTACFSCNRGKSDVPLDVALPGVTPESVEAMRLRAELMADYRRWQDELEAQLRGGAGPGLGRLDRRVRRPVLHR